MTPLDQAHAVMEASPEDDLTRLRFYERLADAELVVPLVREPEGQDVEPQTFSVECGEVVVAFDSEERLGAFVEAPVAYVGMAGRALAGMLAEQGLGLGLNLAVAPSQTLLPAEAVAWLAGMLAHRPHEVAEHPREVSAPVDLSEELTSALGAKIATMTGLARTAYMAHVRYEGGREAHLLAFVAPFPGSEAALAQAVGEAVVFSGLEAGSVDVMFLSDGEALARRLSQAALRLDLPQGDPQPSPAAPGTDPDRPPRLR